MGWLHGFLGGREGESFVAKRVSRGDCKLMTAKERGSLECYKACGRGGGGKRKREGGESGKFYCDKPKSSNSFRTFYGVGRVLWNRSRNSSMWLFKSCSPVTSFHLGTFDKPLEIWRYLYFSAAVIHLNIIPSGWKRFKNNTRRRSNHSLHKLKAAKPNAEEEEELLR